MEEVMKMILVRIEEVNKKLTSLEQQMRAIDAKVSSGDNNLGKSLGETNSALGTMRLG